LLVVSLVVLTSSRWPLAADFDLDATAKLLERFSSGGTMDEQTSIWKEILTAREGFPAYCEAMFDDTRDPLVSPDREHFAEEEIAVFQRRRIVALDILARTSVGPYPELAALADLDENGRREAVQMIDHLCKEVRPGAFQRALRHTDGQQRDRVLSMIRMLADTTLVDSVKPLLRIDNSESSLCILNYLQNVAGQADLMRQVVEAHPTNGSLRGALEYLALAGEEQYALDAAIACIQSVDKETGEGAGRFPIGDVRRTQPGDNKVEAAMVLARLRSPRAREAVMDLFRNEQLPDRIRQALLSAFPPFFAEERIPQYEKAYGPDKAPYHLSSLLTWLMSQDSKAGYALAKARLASLCETWDNPESWEGMRYLVWCGDAQAIILLEKAARGDDIRAFHNAVPVLLEAGLWERLPADIDSKLLSLSRDQDGKQYVNYGKLRLAGEQQLTPKVLPILRFLAQNDTLRRERALALMLERGDESVIPELERVRYEVLGRYRVPVLAALSAAGKTDAFEELRGIAASTWRSAAERLGAIEALKNAAGQQRRVACSTLARLLLERHVAVSERAWQSLVEMSGLEVDGFNARADDDTRRRQSMKLIDWVIALQ